jgi:4'-phosphopantetheinyl transferase
VTEKVWSEPASGTDIQLLDLDATARDRPAPALTLLSDAERRRAATLRDETRRRRFVAGRVALRVALGRALGIAPGEVGLRAGARGKPELADAHGAGLGFNLSHSDRLCLIALRRGGQVGVDLQLLESRRPWERLLERICAPEELREARRETGAIGRLAFYERWVAKEAVLKGLGCGLTVSPARVRLRRRPDGSLGLVELPGGPDAAGARRLAALQAPCGFVAALALADGASAADVAPPSSRGM